MSLGKLAGLLKAPRRGWGRACAAAWALILLLAMVWQGLGPGQAQAVSPISVDSMPPVVLATSPPAGSENVDPARKEIRVTFSKDMLTEGMWSWVMISKETFPKISGPVRFLSDKRTCVAPVKLEPGKTYVIWLNSVKHNSFRDTHNNPAVPYLLVFSTHY